MMGFYRYIQIQMPQRKAVKINLQLKSRTATLHSPNHVKPNCSLEMPKPKQQHFLQLTINNKRQCSQPQSRNPENNHCKISQFDLQEDPKWDVVTKQVILNERSRLQPPSSSRVFVDVSLLVAEKMRKEIQLKEKKERQAMLLQLNQKQKNIEFYQKLLVQKDYKLERQREEKVKSYEHYLHNLIQLYQNELERGRQMKQAIGLQQENQMYKQRRRIINKQGRMGLNYTPRRISLLKGIIADSPLLSQSSLNPSCEQKLLAAEHFSFGSKAKPNHPIKDHPKEYAGLMEATGSSRKIIFDE